MSLPLRLATVDLSAISHNVESLRATIGTEHAMAVVKADGYGHGAIPAARAALAGGADWLGVIDIDEALRLRRAGIAAPILTWMHGVDQKFDEAIACGIDIGVSYLDQLDRVAATGRALVQLKVDTGLSRNGAVEAEWESFFAAAAAHERAGRIRVRGLMSHLSNASEADDLAQVARFSRAIELAESMGLTPELIHLAATVGALSLPQSRFSMVRLGLGIYGLSPLTGRSSAELGITPALELSAGIVSVKRVAAGSGVSYGYDYRTAADSTLVLVPLGYGDGIPRHASNRGPVRINGRTYTVSGRVAMDQFVVDVGDDAVRIGDRAVLFGDPATGAPPAEAWASSADTINYEIVTRLGGRIQRRYLGGDPGGGEA